MAEDTKYRDSSISDKRREYMREYRIKNRESIREKSRQWRKSNPDKVRAYDNAYRSANKEKVAKTIKEWWVKNKDKSAAYTDKYRTSDKYKTTLINTKDDRNASRRRWNAETNYSKTWYKNHDEAMRKASLEYSKNPNNREAINRSARDRYKKSREFYIEYDTTKRSRRSALFMKWVLCGGICYICGDFVCKEEVWIDHVIARANGGTNSIENLMPTHRMCNIRKGCKIDYAINRPDLVNKVAHIEACIRRSNGRGC